MSATKAAEPIMVAKVYKDFVDVVIEGKERSLTVNDYVSTMAKHVGLFTAAPGDSSGNRVMQVPRSFVGFVDSEAGKRRKVFMYKEQHRADLLLEVQRTQINTLINEFSGSSAKKKSKELLARMEAGGVEYTDETCSVLRFKSCAMPNLVLMVSLLLNAADKKNYAVEAVKYGFTAHPREMLKALSKDSNNLESLCETLGYMPFPNFYGGNGMCYGGNQVITTVSATDDNYRPLESYMSLVTSSPFNLDLWESLPDRVTERLLNDENVALFGEKFAEKGSATTDKARSLYRHWGRTFLLVNWFSYLSQAKEFPYELFGRR